MELYVLRHAIAEKRSHALWPDDSKRPLTSEGQKKCRECIAGIKKFGVKMDVVLTSPYVRAKQTADIVHLVYKGKKPILCPDLAADSTVFKLVRFLRKKYLKASKIMLIGHEPFLSELVSYLVLGHPGLSMELKKSGLCKLSLDVLRDGECAQIDWILTPKQMILMGKTNAKK